MKLSDKELRVIQVALRWVEWPDSAEELDLGFTVHDLEKVQAKIEAEQDRRQRPRRKK